MERIKKILTLGLLEGYAGKASSRLVNRAAFLGRSSYLNRPETGVYRDEWFTGEHLGGGQELVKVGDKKFTRVYAGGTPSPEELEKLDLTVKDVSEYLKQKITELGDRTRLFKSCTTENEDGWQYSYDILEKNPKIPVVQAVERITCKGTVVHIHGFVLSPIE